MFIPLRLISFVLLEKLLLHDNSACTVKSAHLKVFVEAIRYFAVSLQTY